MNIIIATGIITIDANTKKSLLKLADCFVKAIIIDAVMTINKYLLSLYMIFLLTYYIFKNNINQEEI